LKLAVLVLGVLALAKLDFLNFITGRFETGCFGVRPMEPSFDHPIPRHNWFVFGSESLSFFYFV
jgi:hypothetical protein